MTGGCGFVGTNLVLRLREVGRTVRVLDNFSAVDPGPLEEACRARELDPPEVIEGDVREREAVARAMEGIGAVVHLAAFTNVRASSRDPERGFGPNVQGTFHVLEAARCSNSVRRVVFASSNAAVGEVEGAVDESVVPRPLSPYGASKLYGEALLSSFSEIGDLNTTALRFANAYGPFSHHKDSVVHKFIRRALREKPLEVYGDGRQTRDFIHVDDIASAVQSVLAHDRPGADVYQVATGRETSVNELAGMIRQRAESAGLSVAVRHTDPRPGEIRKNYSSIERIRRDLGWTPGIELTDGVDRVWRFYRETSEGGGA